MTDMKQIIVGCFKDCLRTFAWTLENRVKIDGFSIDDIPENNYGKCLFNKPIVSVSSIKEDVNVIKADSFNTNDKRFSFGDGLCEFEINLNYLQSVLCLSKGKRIIALGDDNKTKLSKELFELLGLYPCFWEREFDYDDLDNDELSQYMKEEYVIIVCDKYDRNIHKKLDMSGFDKNSYYWIEANRNVNEFQFWCENKKNAFELVLDPNYGHNALGIDEEYNGFISYGYNDKEDNYLKIIILGGSTSTGYGVRNKNWCECLKK